MTGTLGGSLRSVLLASGAAPPTVGAVREVLSWLAGGPCLSVPSELERSVAFGGAPRIPDASDVIGNSILPGLVESAAEPCEESPELGGPLLSGLPAMEEVDVVGRAGPGFPATDEVLDRSDVGGFGAEPREVSSELPAFGLDPDDAEVRGGGPLLAPAVELAADVVAGATPVPAANCAAGS